MLNTEIRSSTRALAPAQVFKTDRARLEDVDHLLKLYFTIYGASYPLEFALKREVMIQRMQSPDTMWLVSRDPKTQVPVASVLFGIDRFGKIAKIEGLVVHPEYQSLKLASNLVRTGTDQLLGENGPVNSVYTTTRTNSVGPQLTLLKNGFTPLGIFPNAHKLDEYETLTLFAKYRPGVLEKRAPVKEVPQKLGDILKILETHHGIATPAPLVQSRKKPENRGEMLKFEFIDAPEYVLRRFNETMKDPYDRYYPFHSPNFLMASTNGEVEIYAYFSKKDRYCAIVTLNTPIYALAGRLGGLLNQLKELGVSYIEILMGLQFRKSIEAALDANFLPSAIYPAMRESPENGMMYDFVVLSRTMEPFNFNGMAIDSSFKPYVDQYVKHWKKMYLQGLEVFHGK